VQPTRTTSRNSAHTLFREARDAHNPLGAPEEESSLRWLQEEEEQEVRPWDKYDPFVDPDPDDEEEEDCEEEEEDVDLDEDV
jgi:hypothetical protein